MRLFTLIACAVALACRSEPGDPTISQNVVPVDQGFSLAVGETATIGGADLAITFNRVTEDSRCPSDVQCVWAGNGQIELTARSDNRNTVFRLNTFQGDKDFVVNSYRIRLSELKPAPVSTQQIQSASYRAVLVVTRAE